MTGLIAPPAPAAPREKRKMNLPIGTVRIHNGVRRVKVRMDGPPAGRWIDYALHWWRTNRGPVPAGKRVCHLDLDPLNDDPANYGLMTAADLIFTWHDRNPKKSERNFTKMREAVADFNRDQGITRRALGAFPQLHWLAVDLAGRRIFIDQVWRKCIGCYRAFGVAGDDPRRVRAQTLGWPGGIGPTAAGVLSVLADAAAAAGNGETARVCADALIERTSEFLAARNWNPMEGASFANAARLLISRGMIAADRRRHSYAIRPTTLAARGPVCPIVPIVGSALTGERFAGFSRVRLEDADRILFGLPF